jgi:hypothetical protein
VCAQGLFGIKRTPALFAGTAIGIGFDRAKVLADDVCAHCSPRAALMARRQCKGRVV